MKWLNQKGGACVVAIVLPFAIQLPLVMLGRYVRWTPWLFDSGFIVRMAYDVVSVLLSSGVGFLVLARRFRPWAVVIGLLYFPLMMATLIYFSLLVVGYVFDDWI